MPSVSIALLVLKTHQLERMRAFYSLLGIEFHEEKHGNGPVHFAGKVNQLIFEIYPLKDTEILDTSTRLGFFVEHLEGVLDSLWQTDFCEPKTVKQTEWGNRAVVHDPDGRAVELYQKPNAGILRVSTGG